MHKIQSYLADILSCFFHNNRTFANVVQQTRKVGIREVRDVVFDLGAASCSDCKEDSSHRYNN